MANKLIMYGAEWCPVCRQARTWLAQEQVEVDYRDIDADRIFYDELVGLGSQGVPTFVMGREVVIGFRPDKLKQLVAE